MPRHQHHHHHHHQSSAPPPTTTFDPFRPSIEAVPMDLRSSPSQQHLNPSRSSSLPSQQDEMDVQDSGATANEKSSSHKIDLYSIPVFLLEILVLLALGYGAYFLHFQYPNQPLITGFYCDDISYRQVLRDTHASRNLYTRDGELGCLSLLLSLPIVLIVFCELVNSMFGSLKFRQIRALCTCCRLHSITRRTFRFAGAYLLGLAIVMISCDVLISSTGRLRPYFAQDCASAYSKCLNRPSDLAAAASTSSAVPSTSSAEAQTGAGLDQAGRIRQPQQQATATLVERQWIDLEGQNLHELCNVINRGPEVDGGYVFNQIAKSWPSFPAAVLTYACLYLACYLCFVGTARPVRIITCALVMLLLLLATMFNVLLVKNHIHHWDDVVAGSVLSFVVVVFVLLVYLNRFKDTHYYQNQKLLMSNNNKIYVHENFRGYSNDGASGQYNLDKSGGIATTSLQNIEPAPGPLSNDLAMRYFQIPRANYRGGPRPMSSINQMR